MNSTTLSPARQDFMQVLSLAILRITGWHITGEFPNIQKYIIVGAPHTSNWDFPLTMLLMFGSGVRFNWIAKASLFRWPFGGLLRRMGGIPVWRDRKTNFVSQTVEAFDKAAHLIIAISPEGTRSKVARWKTGFYYMAMGAKVPIVMGFVDYARKQVGIGPVLYPSGNIDSDFAVLREFYSDKTGRFPDKHGVIEVQPESQPEPPATE
jgi:1-acyl-sn-glycerol-3-phosphate acyltransferase